MSEPRRLRLIFAGTPQFAADQLAGILERDEHDIVAVYSQPDRAAKRGKKITASAVKELALQHHIPVYQPVNFKSDEALTELAGLDADLMVVVAYGLLLPLAVLESPQLGCINVHGSLLPRWRGAAPVQRAIEAGDDESGIVIMQMDEGLDTGDMLLETRCTLSPDETTGSLFAKLTDIGIPALNKTISQLATNTANASPQDNNLSNYAHKISKAELLIDWQQPAAVLERKIRAYNPAPVAYTTLGGERIKIWAAKLDPQSGEAGTIVQADKAGIVVACGKGALNIQQLQMPGKKPMATADLLNSKAELFKPGNCFGDTQ